MIYTAITGGRDHPRDDIKCFTGSVGFDDPRMNAKAYKVLSHLYLPDVRRSLWLDGNIHPLKTENQLFDELCMHHDLALFEHPFRQSVADELDFLIEHKIIADGPDVQSFISRWGPLEDLPLYEGGILLRRHYSAVEEFNAIWWSLICRYSFRDQITLPIAIESTRGLRVAHIKANLRNYPSFEYRDHVTMP